MNNSPEKIVFDFLKKHNLPFKNYVHKPVFKVGDPTGLDEDLPGAHTKNLFLKNKNDKFWLVSMLQHNLLDIKKFQEIICSGKLSFGSEDELMAKLNITPGSVTPFALINPGSRAISVVLDSEMMQHDSVLFHPLRNDMSININRDDFLKFIELCGHKPQIISLPKKP